MLYTECSFFYGCQWPLLGPKNVKLAWKFLVDVIKDEEKICHMDNRSGQWAKFSSPLWKEIPVHHHFLHFEALFPKGRKSITFDIFLTVQNCIPCAVDPTSIWYIFFGISWFFPGKLYLTVCEIAFRVQLTWKPFTTEGKEKAKTFWQFCFYAWVALATLMVTNKQINCCQECHSGFTIESRCRILGFPPQHTFLSLF